MKQYINSKLEAQLQEKEEYRKMREEEKKNKSKKANIMIQVYRYNLFLNGFNATVLLLKNLLTKILASIILLLTRWIERKFLKP